jgi:mono/diheme cytochrome c family protein
VSALRGIDRGLAWITWLVAAALVLMLFIGPRLVAEDDPEASANEQAPAYDSGGGAAADGEADGGADPAAAADGQALFVENCGSCHTLSDAGTSGSVGPSLDGAGLSPEAVTAIVNGGSGSMPSFSGTLDEAQIDAIAAYVSSASGG